MFYQLVLIVSGGLEFADGSCHHPRKLCVHGHEGVVPHDVTDLAELLVKVVGPNLFDATLLIGLKSGQGRGQTGSGKCSRGTRVVAGKDSQVQPLFAILCWLFHCKIKITVLFLTRRGLVSERLYDGLWAPSQIISPNIVATGAQELKLLVVSLSLYIVS